MPFVEGDSTQVARPVRPVSLTGAVADLDARQRQDDRALVPRTTRAVPALTGANGSEPLGDVDPGDSVSTTWTPPGSGDAAVWVTLTASTNTYTGTAVLLLDSAGWEFTFSNGTPSATTAMAVVPAGEPLTITAASGAGSTGPVAFAVFYAAVS